MSSRESFWVIGDKARISRVSGRFLVELDGRKTEVAAVKTDTLVVDAALDVTTGALGLASEHDVTISCLASGLKWFTSPFPQRDVETLLRQYEAARVGSDIEKRIEEAYRREYRRLARKLGSSDLAEGVARRVIWSRAGVAKVAGYLKQFLYAEALDAVVKAGLTPYIGFVNKGFLPADLAMEFEPYVLWPVLLHLNFPEPETLSTEVKRRLARLLKSRLGMEAVSQAGVRASLRKHMRLQAKAMASVVRRPAVRYEAFKVVE